MLGNPNRKRQQGNKPPRCHWYATHRFIDIKLSHIIEGVLALALLCAASAQVFVYLRQASIMNRQLAVMQRQLTDAEIQEAASITIRNLAVKGFPDDTFVSYDVLNTGRTRASQVTIDPGYMYFPAREEMSVLTRSFGGRTTPSELGITIDPSDPPRHITVHFGAVPKYPDMPPEERKKLPSKEDIKSGRVASAFHVIGTYSDVFGNTQHVADCVIFHDGAGFEPCFGQQNRHY